MYAAHHNKANSCMRSYNQNEGHYRASEHVAISSDRNTSRPISGVALTKLNMNKSPTTKWASLLPRIFRMCVCVCVFRKLNKNIGNANANIPHSGSYEFALPQSGTNSIRCRQVWETGEICVRSNCNHHHHRHCRTGRRVGVTLTILIGKALLVRIEFARVRARVCILIETIRFVWVCVCVLFADRTRIFRSPCTMRIVAITGVACPRVAIILIEFINYHTGHLVVSGALSDRSNEIVMCPFSNRHRVCVQDTIHTHYMNIAQRWGRSSKRAVASLQHIHICISFEFISYRAVSTKFIRVWCPPIDTISMCLPVSSMYRITTSTIHY